MVLLEAAVFGSTAAAEDTGPKLVVVGEDKTVKPKWKSGEGESEGEMVLAARVRLVMSNTGQQATLAPEAFLDAVNDGSDAECTQSGKVTAKVEGTRDVRAGDIEPVMIKLTVPEMCANRNGTLVLAAGAGEPAKVRFAIPRQKAHEPGYIEAFWAAVAGSAFVALLMGVSAYGGFLKPLPIDKPWRVDDSWLTNISALGAVLGTVLTTTGFVDDWLPGVSLGPLLGLNLLYGVFVLFAPVVYAASCTWKWEAKSSTAGSGSLTPAVAVNVAPAQDASGSGGANNAGAAGGAGSGEQELKVTGKGLGLWLAAAVTLFGVFGQLATVGALVNASSAPDSARPWLLVLLGAGRGRRRCLCFPLRDRGVGRRLQRAERSGSQRCDVTAVQNCPRVVADGH
ncbi:hypothetical protein OHA02_52355 [Streptomyces phaeochromogenes]|nr:hypothetical protein [Streptomyces phaeochromogenes]